MLKKTPKIYFRDPGGNFPIAPHLDTPFLPKKQLTLWLNSGSPTRTQRQFGRQLFQNPESIQDQIGNPIQDQFRDPIQKRIRNPIPNQIRIPPIQDPIQEQIGNPIEDQFQELNPTDGEDGSYSYSNPGGFTNFRLVV